jgi:predicted nucleotidyltransferase
MKYSMKLTEAEQKWLDDYRKALEKQFPGVIERMIIYGSKARGDSHPDSDIDILIIVPDSDSDLRLPIRRLGYRLAAVSEAVPSIMAYTHSEWNMQKQIRLPLVEAVERDGVVII